ncbi:MAG TPA: type II secretion system secretin GspD [Burkholderiales bacterium]
MSLATVVAQDDQNPPPVAPQAPTPQPTVPPEPSTPPTLPVSPPLPRPTPPPTQPSVQRTIPVGVCEPKRADEFCVNFQAADIQGVVKTISQITGRNFLLDPRVKGQVTIISQRPIPRAAVYDVFLSALKAQGFTAVDGPSGLARIIPIAEGRQGAEVQRDTPRGGERITTHVAILQNISPTQMVPLLRPLMSPTSQISAHEPTNALIITDFADNTRRMLAIIEKLDQPISSDVTVVPLQNASALDLAELIARLAGPAGGAGAPGVPIPQAPGGGVAGDRFTVIPDLRTNSLLIRTENPGRLTQLRSLIAKLDVPATTDGQTRVIYLRNAEAVKLAEVLRGLLAAEARTQQPAAAAAGTVAVGRAGASRRTAEASLVQADEATNALIINASDAVYNNLRSVIEKLDVRRAQVFVEALIAEITTDNAAALGFQWAAAGSAGSGAVGGVTNLPTTRIPSIVGTIVNPAATLATASGFSLAFLGRTITLPDGSQVRGIGALAQALESKNLGNILSTPNLLTLDNAEAKIIVGQNVPFLTGSFLPTNTANAGTNVNPFSTIERKDIGIQLRIKPQISEGGGVKMEIFQEISTVTPPPPGITASDIITNKRSVETKVLVDDGATVVLGGLIEDRSTETRSEVPLLGRIPLLGALFRSTETTKQKTNLMVFLKPTIIRSVDEGHRLAVDRYEYMRVLRKDAEPSQAFESVQPTLPPAAPAPKQEPENSAPKTAPNEEDKPG